ncbi:acyl-CoA dehydrogenase family protein [Yinghuangia sp. ASG 101]|uniref:acyl-CoA dehydrogenase family protein n=1 Tax=Yinghuangia sp. ASG 101 TaxID=2896848 RepID=UPI001E42D1E3|nr:acyl-CoA dehydrogenase family protein [Yinghuangia sp. ASG 101]UGQ12280.1 acyl-CoA dehydrogenase family protein [Yinghuangia sp. ASG 101]
MTDSTAPSESVEAFRTRARAWLAANMPRVDPDAVPPLPGEDDHLWRRARELQRKLHAGGFAGICFPKEYGGLGLPRAYQDAFTEESAGYEMPVMLNVPTFSICCATLLDVGSEEQKRTHISAAIRGEEVLVQFLSEPGGGSDLAGLLTRAERDGDGWVLNGSKTWSTWAYAADYGLCLARTDSDKPKHDGLTMFLVPTNAPGLTINRIRMVDGSTEFCEEFFDNVRVDASAVVGEIDGGWAVATQQLYHERTAVGGGSPFVSGRGATPNRPKANPFAVAQATKRTADPEVRTMLGDMLTLAAVRKQLQARVAKGIAGGHLPPPSASLLRLFHAEYSMAEDDLALRIAGSLGGFGPDAGPGHTGMAGVSFLGRQGAGLGGGSTEMSRNIISERLLGMPREPAPDRGVPFNQIKRGSR